MHWKTMMSLTLHSLLASILLWCYIWYTFDPLSTKGLYNTWYLLLSHIMICSSVKSSEHVPLFIFSLDILKVYPCLQKALAAVTSCWAIQLLLYAMSIQDVCDHFSLQLPIIIKFCIFTIPPSLCFAIQASYVGYILLSSVPIAFSTSCVCQIL